MNIAIIGSGYVGLVTGACLSEFGHQIVCMDKDGGKIERLCNGEIPIYEPGLKELIDKGVGSGRLSFTTDIACVKDAQVVFIAVGTPTSRRGDGYADLTYIYSAAKDLAPHLSSYTVLVDKSTVPVGTARQVARVIKEANPEAQFDVVSNPEFLREGAAITDFMRPDRVVIGTESERSEGIMKEVYNSLFVDGSTPFVITGLETAELIKYASNAFLSMKISFINEMANVCEALGADVVDLAKAVGLDGRIGRKFLHAGPGYGGSCFPKDALALLRIAQENGVPIRTVAAAVETNAAQKAAMVKKIRDALGGSEAGKTIGVLGLTFKPETDDLRDAPALTILPPLFEKGAKIQAHDPQG
ncbi:MAG: UDP-glucose/GDP-mannose dehydrogenase family protein, partial [Candidatus Moranbacteria bacterium]|nr:UDP-glucose/GDP-mannose dehydrogenase family protein [Candidatus Moranbacteria bacterium]